MTATLTAGPWDVSRAEYHSDAAHVSHSALDDFRRSIPYYAGRYVLGTIPAPEPTLAMRLGSAFHTLLLQPDLWERCYAVAPEKCDRRTSRGKAEWAELEARAAGRQIVSHDDWLLLQAMREGAMANAAARQALERPGTVERAIRWTDPDTGTPCKALPDKTLPSGLVLDLKSCLDPSPEAFAKACTNLGYARQGPWYLEGAWRAAALDGPFMFVAVGKEAPHETICYVLDGPALELGRQQNRALLAELASRRVSGDWSGRWAGEIQTLTLPRWAFS